MHTTLLTNGQSGYLALGKKTTCKYQGGYFSDGNTLLRTLENTSLDDLNEAESIWQYGDIGFRKWKNSCTEAFQLRQNTILYERKGEAKTTIFLDCKQSYDNHNFGRNYQVEQMKNGILVTYTKQNNVQESKAAEYEYFVCIQLSKAKTTIIEEWIRHEYPYDAARENIDPERFVFALLQTESAKFTLTGGMEKVAVLAEAKAYASFFDEKNTLFEQNSNSSNTVEEAAKNALLGLISEMHGRIGLLAGFPWFFQYWTRDEAISARGLMLCGKEGVAKKILLHLIEQIDNNGRIPNRIPAADLGCADGVGWTFLRLKELYQMGKLTKKEIQKTSDALLLSLNRLEKQLFEDGLVRNNRLETWMDTENAGDVRAGFRIEIQALTLAMYRFAFELTKDDTWQQKEQAMRERVRTEFWQNGCLFDGKDDATVRPNLFLAVYAYPELLSQNEWKQCFDAALKQLWLDWGGLATIATNHPLFQNHYTGQDNRSYHRGDSWFFVNCFAAIALQRCDAQKYKEYVAKIYAACSKDVLENGAFGAASEVSSAAEQTSHGCWSQAWSNALFVELQHELESREKE